ncbi:uncharacterized protein LOC132739614 [Ruditapes philippinarum]|uniref:uncharacterized protein LOC132739614 n=1 Tax=Ruditapes philippinarum TaxID=129788 RepID=UPI00295B0EA4|nr:uncharacterized protein LOC132739614 [Ruditapes philippinarum]
MCLYKPLYKEGNFQTISQQLVYVKMGSAAMLKHVSNLLVIALLILGTCSAHKSSGGSHKGSSSNKRGGYGYGYNDIQYGNTLGRGRGNLRGLSNCYSRGARPCYGIANAIHCYNPRDQCNGRPDCPMGDDEMNCQGGANAIRTVFSTRTSTRTTTSTSTTTTTTTTSTTTTVASTMTTMSTSSRKLTAIVPYIATSSAATAISTTSKTYDALMTVPAGMYPNADIICMDLMAVAAAAVVPAARLYHYRPVTWTISITPTAHVSCMPSTTTYV